MSIKVWADKVANGVATIFTDCKATADALSTAKSRDPALLTAACELWLVAARHHITLLPTHLDPSQLQQRLAEPPTRSTQDINEYLFMCQSNL